MKRLLLSLALASQAFAQVIVESPVTLAVTVTSTQPTVVTDKGASSSTLVARYGNKELLQECVVRGLIPSTDGWRVVLAYDSAMDDVYTGSDPYFELRHTDGRIVSASQVIRVESVAASGGGKASFPKGTLTGSLKRLGYYTVTAEFQGDTVQFAGTIPFNLKLTGTPEAYFGTSSAVTASLSGFIEDDYDSTCVLVLKAPAFKRR